jgi:hypothetical protein
MAQKMTILSEFAEKVLAIVKKKNKLRTKADAMNLVIETYGIELLDLPLKKSFIKKMERIEKEFAGGNARRYTSFEEFRADIEISRILQDAGQVMTLAELEKELPEGITHQMVVATLNNLQRNGKIIRGAKGILWVHENKKRLRALLNKGTEI